MKFRGKRKDNKKWVKGSLIDNAFFKKDGSSITYIGVFSSIDFDSWENLDECIDIIEVIPESVGMSTGQPDKNGVEIFGSILVGDIMSRGGDIWVVRNQKKDGYLEMLNIEIDFTQVCFRGWRASQGEIIGKQYEEEK